MAGLREMLLQEEDRLEKILQKTSERLQKIMTRKKLKKFSWLNILKDKS